MAFTKQPPRWENTGAQPPEEKLASGWLPKEKVPAPWLNWYFNGVYESLKELQENGVTAEDLEAAIQDVNIEVIDSVNSTDKTKPGSANAVKTAYDKATNVDSKIQAMMFGNPVKNSSGLLGMKHWTTDGHYEWISYEDVKVGAAFACDNYIDTMEGNATITSEAIKVNSGSSMTVQAMFLTSRTPINTGSIGLFVLNAANDQSLVFLEADLASDWHRKTKSFLIPGDVTSVKLRFYIEDVEDGRKAISRIKLFESSVDAPYSNEGDIVSLGNDVAYLNNQIYNVKNDISTVRKPSELKTANIVKNPTAALDLEHWKVISGSWDASHNNQTVGSFFNHTASLDSGFQQLRTVDPIAVSPGAVYNLQAVMHSTGVTPPGTMGIEVMNGEQTSIIARLSADPSSWWHRKSMSVTIPAGVTSVYLCLVINGPVSTGVHAFSRIMFNESSYDVPFTDEQDTRLLFQSVSDGKAKLKETIITEKEGTVSQAGSTPTFDELDAGIRSIQQGRYATQTITLNQGFVQEWAVAAGYAGTVGPLYGTFAAGTKLITCVASGYSSTYGYFDFSYYRTSGGDFNYCSLCLIDDAGRTWNLMLESPWNNAIETTKNYIAALTIDLVAGTSQLSYGNVNNDPSTLIRRTSTMPSDFNVNGETRLQFVNLRAITSVNQKIYTYTNGITFRSM